MPGVYAVVLGEGGEELPAGQKGMLAIRGPWPGIMAGIHGEPERYKKTYGERFPGFYYAGDYAIRDEDGYFWLLGRADEVLKVAGHRLGTLELENAAVEHEAVAEAAAVARPDPVKGDVVVLFVTLTEDYVPSEELKESATTCGRPWERLRAGRGTVCPACRRPAAANHAEGARRSSIRAADRRHPTRT
jgi:acetyl-CoA synthetase